MNDDRKLLEAWTRGRHEEAFRELVDRHLNRVWGTARRVTGDPDAARDVAQAVFNDLARKADRIPAFIELAGWLHRAAVLEALRHNRDQARRHQRERDAMDLQAAPDGSPEDAGAIERLLPQLDAALLELPDADRRAILQRYFDGRSFADIGAAQGVSDDTAQKRVTRAVEKLRGILSRRGIAVTAGILGAAMQCAGAQTAPVGMAGGIAGAALLATSVPTGGGAALVWMIAMKTQLALVALAVVSTAAVWMLAPRPAQAGTLPIIVTTGTRPETSPAPPAAPGGTAAPNFAWAQVESADYRQYAANLRAIGCPEELVRDIIRADVRKTMAQKYRDLLSPPANRQWWQKPQPQAGPDAATRARIAEAQLEESAVVRAILGGDASSEEFGNQLFLQPNGDLLALGFLPDDTWRRAVQRLQRAGIRREGPTDGSSGSNWHALENERLDRQAALLKDILDPAQLKEFKRRASPWMQVLYFNVAYFDGTEAEFDRLATLHEGNVRSGMIFWGNRPMTGVAEALGVNRAAELERVVDPAYRLTRMAAERFELAPELADAAMELKRTTLASAESIRTRAGLSEVDRRAQLARLRADAENRIISQLGTNAFRMVQKLGGTFWMKFIEEPEL